MIDITRITQQRYSTFFIICGSLLLGMFLRTPFDQWNPLYSKEHTPANLSQPITTDPNLAATLEQLFREGDRLLKNSEHPKAMNHFKALLSTHPHIIESLVRLGTAAFHQNLYESAATYFRTALFLDPNNISTYMRLGLALHKLKEFQKAENAFKIVLKSAPTYSEVYIQLIRVLMDNNKLDEAVATGKKAVELAPQDIHAHLNLGHVYNKRGDTDLAIESYRSALAINNDFPNANYNLGYTLRLEGKLNEAIPYLEKALRLQPHYPDAHIALAQAYWSLDDFTTAWKHYYYRWQLHGVDPEKVGAPLWDGSDLHGKTILLYAEQGMGDTLQFIRFAKEVKKRGARVICKVQEPLKQLLSSYPYVDTIVGKNARFDEVDVQAALMSVPGIIGTQPNTIPAEIPYLTIDSALVQEWKNKLAHDTNFKIGICWKVDPQHELTKSPLSLRSLPLAVFAELADIPGISFYSLQKTTDLEDFKNKPASFIVNTFNPDFDETNGRFMDTAAVIQNLDLIISVDTSVIHVAGALGKPVWVLLPLSPDCRWYFTGDTTPWYPTMRMFRQQKRGDYTEPMRAIKEALKKVLNKKGM